MLYLIAAGSNPTLSRFHRLRGGFFYHLIDNMLRQVYFDQNYVHVFDFRNLRDMHANQISDPLQYGLLCVLEAFWIAG